MLVPASMPSGIRCIRPVDVVPAPDLTISEYIGRVASGDEAISACVATVRSATKEAPQKPDFDEYVIVLEGEVHIMHGVGLSQETVISAGEGLVLTRGTRVQWVWPGPCKYVPICLPAFSPSNCGREEATGPVAKTKDSMVYLRQLHASAAAPGRAVLADNRHRVAAGVGVGLILGILIGRALR